MYALVNRDFCAALVLSMVHFLWQGVLIGGLAAVCFGWLKSARIRYAGFIGALMLMLFSPLFTLVILRGSEKQLVSPLIAKLATSSVVPTIETSAFEVDVSANPVVESMMVDNPPFFPARTEPGHAVSASTRPFIERPLTHPADWHRFAPMMICVYLLGVTFMITGIYQRASIAIDRYRQRRNGTDESPNSRNSGLRGVTVRPEQQTDRLCKLFPNYHAVGY